MITFYIIGCALTLLFLLTFYAWMLSKKETDVEFSVEVIAKLVMMSALSWIFLFIIVTSLMFEKVQEDKDEIH